MCKLEWNRVLLTDVMCKLEWNRVLLTMALTTGNLMPAFEPQKTF